jgi:hypothetical protein
VAEEPAADDVIIGAVQLEKKWLADLESTELLLAARLPEINLVQPFQAGHEVEPFPIRDSDEEAHLLALDTKAQVTNATFTSLNALFWRESSASVLNASDELQVYAFFVQ